MSISYEYDDEYYISNVLYIFVHIQYMFITACRKTTVAGITGLYVYQTDVTPANMFDDFKVREFRRVFNSVVLVQLHTCSGTVLVYESRNVDDK